MDYSVTTLNWITVVAIAGSVDLWLLLRYIISAFIIFGVAYFMGRKLPVLVIHYLLSKSFFN